MLTGQIRIRVVPDRSRSLFHPTRCTSLRGRRHATQCASIDSHMLVAEKVPGFMVDYLNQGFSSAVGVEAKVQNLITEDECVVGLVCVSDIHPFCNAVERTVCGECVTPTPNIDRRIIGTITRPRSGESYTEFVKICRELGCNRA